MIVAEGIAPPGVGHSLPVLVMLVVVLVAIVAARRSPAVARLVKAGGDVSAALVPRALALTTFLAGVILLFSGATPAQAGRMGWLNDILPLPIIEVSAYFESVAGVALILVARGLQRRLDAAYHLTLWLLGAGIVFAIASALDFEQATVLAGMLIAFAPSRRFFYRRSSLIDERFTTGWSLAIAGAVIATAALMYQGYGHQVVTTRVFWDFGSAAEGARAARALTLAIVTLLVLSLARLLRPSRARAAPTVDPADVEAIVRASPCAHAHLALLGDKEILLDESKSAFLMTGSSGSCRVVMGDPIGPLPQATTLLDTFVRQCEREGTWPVFYRVGPDLLYLYLEYGLSVVKLGEVARVTLADFSLEGPKRRNLRRVWRKLVDANCSFEIVSADGATPYLSRLRQVSDDWLAQKRVREKGFSLGRFDERFIARGPVAIVRVAGTIIAFATLWVSGEHAEVAVDLMRHTTDAPAGVMRYVLMEAMLWARAQGYAEFNLGMVPLAGIRSGEVAPLWNQLANVMRLGGERYYNFQGLREFKEWFHPEWEPNYLVSPGGAKRPIIVANIAALIARGAGGVIRK